MTKREITEAEWSRYRWEEIELGVFLRGIELIDPPNDGYYYVDVTTNADKKQRWARAVVVENEP